ncbi:MAG: hypothetical protein LBM61_06385 [Prevotellaceae bacterium]|jgi:hypothetical protein|nr:hypothetical protein [Prevotellaceae bacterium]
MESTYISPSARANASKKKQNPHAAKQTAQAPAKPVVNDDAPILDPTNTDEVRRAIIWSEILQRRY